VARDGPYLKPVALESGASCRRDCSFVWSRTASQLITLTTISVQVRTGGFCLVVAINITSNRIGCFCVSFSEKGSTLVMSSFCLCALLVPLKRAVLRTNDSCERGHPVVYYRICVIYYAPSIHNIHQTRCNNYN